jgi:SAM-dependent methyltransferase
MPGDLIDPEILAYYQHGRETTRLHKDAEGLLERVRTEELLQRFLPVPPATILDVGGGPGHYAMFLSALGYDVHLIDPVPLHLEQARQGSIEATISLAGIQLGDARNLPVPNAAAAAVLLFGPLYHLTRREERVQALTEAHRVLAPGGVVLCAVISRFASALDGLSKHLFDDPIFTEVAHRDLARGLHLDGLPDGTRGRVAYFTAAYLHHPDEIRGELIEAGFQFEQLLAVEGPAWQLQDLDAQWADPSRRAAILDIVRRVEAEPSLLGASSHLLAIARRP